MTSTEMAGPGAVASPRVPAGMPMPREEPAGRTLRSMGLAADELEDITWHNCFRFLDTDPPKLFSSGEQHYVG